MSRDGMIGLSEFIKKRRKMLKLSKARFAANSGLTQDTVWRLERAAQQRIMPKTINKLGTALGVSNLAISAMVDGLDPTIALRKFPYHGPKEGRAQKKQPAKKLAKKESTVPPNAKSTVEKPSRRFDGKAQGQDPSDKPDTDSFKISHGDCVIEINRDGSIIIRGNMTLLIEPENE